MSTLSAAAHLDPPVRESSPDRTGGAAKGAPHVILRLEAAALMIAAVAAYARMDGHWWIFAALFLVPDLSMLGYLAGPVWGAAAYNTAHATLLPISLGLLGIVLTQHALLSIALIWAAHIGFDRMLGYGLKYGTAFGHTHLGAVGKAKGARV